MRVVSKEDKKYWKRYAEEELKGYIFYGHNPLVYIKILDTRAKRLIELYSQELIEKEE